jgi:CheY-like chemotaxis protein
VKILLVEDDDSLRKAFERLFSAEGWEVVVAVDGLDAQERLSQNADTRIILSDNNMPKISGLELLACVKKEYPAIRFILMSGYEIVEEAFEKGADGFLRKPFGREECIREIEKALMAK